MKQLQWNLSLLSLFLCSFFSFSLFAQNFEGENVDKTLSPYFFVKSDDLSLSAKYPRRFRKQDR